MEFTIVIYYILLILGVSLLSLKWTRNQEGYFLASRSLGPFQLTSTLAATSIGGSAVILVIGQVYANGLPFVWTDIAGGAGLILLGVLLAGKVRETGCYSLPEIAGLQYGPGARLISSLLVVVAELGFLALLLRGCAGLVQPIFGLQMDGTVIAVCLFFVAYTVLGGQRAVAQTDVLQLMLTLGGVGLLVILVVNAGGAWESLPADHMQFPFNEQFPPVNILSLVLITGLPHVVGSDIFGKLLSARDPGTARVAAINAGMLKIFVGIMAGCIGLYAAVLLPADLASDSIVSELLLLYAGPLLSGLIIVALVATLMSSADSVLLTTATVLTRDIVRLDSDSSAIPGKLMTVFAGIAGIALTLLFPTMLSAFLFAYTIFSGAIVVPVLLGFWRKQLALSSWGAMGSMVVGGGLIIILSMLSVSPEVVTMAGILGNATVLFLFSWLERLFSRGSQ